MPITKNLSITLIQCPGPYPNVHKETPPYEIALLTGNLRSKGYKVHSFDLSNEFYRIVSEKYKSCWHAEEYRFWNSTESVKEVMKLYNAYIEAEIKKILEKSSQLVIFNVYESTLIFTLEIARRIKRDSPETLIILGGLGTVKYDGSELKLQLLKDSAVDAIAIREGDETFPQICADLEQKGAFRKIPGLFFKKDGRIINGGEREPIKSLDALPFPDYSDFDLNRYENPWRLDIVSSRSCINKCYFCSERNYYQHFRFRSGKSLFEEIKYHLSKFPKIHFFLFIDSLINGSPKEIRRFSELLLRNNIRIGWEGKAIIRKEMTPDLLRLMAKAGCNTLFYGVESGSDKVLKSMNKGTGFTAEIAGRVLKDTHEAGIRAGAAFMFGYPTETEEDFQMTLDFIRKNYKWIDTLAASHWFTAIIPGTYLYKNSGEFGIEDVQHPVFWSSQQRRNTYPVRFDRYERFCKLCLKLGLGSSLSIVEERKDKWKYLGEYYQYKKDHEKAIDCYFQDFLKHGYSPESIKGFFECCALAQGEEEACPLPHEGANKLISLYNKTINS